MLYSSQKPSVAEQTANRITEMIRTGEYATGDRLPSERKLAEQLQVGRTSVREAIRQLEVLGLVEARLGLGTFVKDPSSELLQASLISHVLPDKETILKLFDLREIIEVDAAARAANRANDQQIRQMQYWQQMVETYIARNDTKGITTADVEFHRRIIIATDNDILVKLMDSIVDLLRDMRNASSSIVDHLPEIVNGHRMIMAAIERGDDKLAAQAMRDHLNTIRLRVSEFWAMEEEETDNPE